MTILAILPVERKSKAMEGRVPVREIASFYRFEYGLCQYATWKLRMDPVFSRIAALLALRSLPILDLGCGIGLLAAVLRKAHLSTPFLGIDCDAQKIGTAHRALGDHFANVTFSMGDVTAPRLFSGDVIAMDVLHYLPRENQRDALKHWASMLAPGGMLLVRTPLHEPGWRLFWTGIEEWFLRKSGWLNCGKANFPTRRDLLEPMEEAGFNAELTPLWGRTPFNSHLLIVTRPGE